MKIFSTKLKNSSLCTGFATQNNNNNGPPYSIYEYIIPPFFNVLVTFSSGEENLHWIEPVSNGTRQFKQ